MAPKRIPKKVIQLESDDSISTPTAAAVIDKWMPSTLENELASKYFDLTLKEIKKQFRKQLNLDDQAKAIRLHLQRRTFPNEFDQTKPIPTKYFPEDGKPAYQKDLEDSEATIFLDYKTNILQVRLETLENESGNIGEQFLGYTDATILDHVLTELPFLRDHRSSANDFVERIQAAKMEFMGTCLASRVTQAKAAAEAEAKANSATNRDELLAKENSELKKRITALENANKKPTNVQAQQKNGSGRGNDATAPDHRARHVQYKQKRGRSASKRRSPSSFTTKKRYRSNSPPERHFSHSRRRSQSRERERRYDDEDRGRYRR